MAQKSLLIVDDEDDVRSILALSLRDEGYSIRMAESGAEALKLLREAPVDMVLSDYVMPGMNGMELMKEVFKEFPNTLRIILTGKPDLELAIQAMNNGTIHRFLVKPWDQLDLQVNVRLGFDRLALDRENRHLLAMVKRQSDFIRELEKDHPGLVAGRTATEGPVLIDDEEILWQFAATLKGRGW
jgi:DNA-binding NtrC family response regulator